jgi:glycyl-tRNA synthetase alpha subunit
VITVEIGDLKVSLVPRTLHNYIEKIDYIKSRRPSPYASLSGIPDSMSAEGKQKMAEIALQSYMKMSSVSFEEEIAFDCSFEGFYFSLWQAAKNSIKEWQKLSAFDGVAKAKDWFEQLDSDKATEVRLAIRGIDQRSLAKNSDGPQENQE